MKRVDQNGPKCSDALWLELRLVAKPIGSFSLAGVQMKVSAGETPVLSCSGCDWTVAGRIEDGKAVFGKEKDVS